jgi:hypothetical protein
MSTAAIPRTSHSADLLIRDFGILREDREKSGDEIAGRNGIDLRMATSSGFLLGEERIIDYFWMGWQGLSFWQWGRLLVVML